jgi:hypothetical protein
MIPIIVIPTGTNPIHKQTARSSLLGRLKEEHAAPVEDDDAAKDTMKPL